MITFNEEYLQEIKPSDSMFVKTLKTLMWVKRIKQEQLAKILGCRQSQCSNWLNGKSLPNYYYLQQLKNKFDVGVEHFFD